jgi:hypothetical protein
MPITNIEVIENEELPKKLNPIKERMDIYIPGIPEGLSRRNGMIYILCGSGGSGKTSLLLNLFKSRSLYRCKFHTIFYICPSSSFCSVEKHPFADHPKVYHELTVELLETIYNYLIQVKEEGEIEYSCVVIDDFADSLKDKHIQAQLNKMLIKSRHLQCSFIFTLQGYLYFPKMLRKQITYATIFKKNNAEEYDAISKELLFLNRDDSLTLFDYVFDEPYNHLDVDTRENKLYKNFETLLIEKD